ncbi:MAG: NADP-dependent isocitrate dehydrogenase [Pseudomonadota bacterium]
MAASPQPSLLPDTVCVAEGDGIGPEITRATLAVLRAAGAPLRFNPVSMGISCFREDLTSGIPPSTWDAIRDAGVLLKGPMTTPQGSGMKSLNVTLRKSLGLYANVRPVRSYAPFIRSNFPTADLVIIRENEEDLYAGIEHRQTEDVVQCLKLVSRPGCERIIRYAFEYVRTRGRHKLTCMTKDNIMKLTDGLFHDVFDEVAREYPAIEAEHMIIDIGMARVASRPQDFDVIVTPNLYGDILSDVAAEITGSVGIAPSANIGARVSVFEAIHGSAPDIAGKDIANPSALLLSAAKMLAHLGHGKMAELIHNAWLCTMERGLHTADVYTEGTSTRRLGTTAFAEAVISLLGQMPEQLKPATYPDEKLEIRLPPPGRTAAKQLVGVDVFVQSRAEPAALGEQLAPFGGPNFELSMITNRGVQVWPTGMPETSCTDHWRCRFTAVAGKTVSNTTIVGLLSRLAEAGVEFVKTEHLYEFDGKKGFSLGQGQ